jgi:hypothetical protein
MTNKIVIYFLLLTVLCSKTFIVNAMQKEYPHFLVLVQKQVQDEQNKKNSLSPVKEKQNLSDKVNFTPDKNRESKYTITTPNIQGGIIDISNLQIGFEDIYSFCEHNRVEEKSPEKLQENVKNERMGGKPKITPEKESLDHAITDDIKLLTLQIGKAFLSRNRTNYSNLEIVIVANAQTIYSGINNQAHLNHAGYIMMRFGLEFTAKNYLKDFNQSWHNQNEDSWYELFEIKDNQSFKFKNLFHCCYHGGQLPNDLGIPVDIKTLVEKQNNEEFKVYFMFKDNNERIQITDIYKKKSFQAINEFGHPIFINHQGLEIIQQASLVIYPSLFGPPIQKYINNNPKVLYCDGFDQFNKLISQNWYLESTYYSLKSQNSLF